MRDTVGDAHLYLFDPKDIPASLRDCFEEVETECGAGWVRVVSKEQVYDPKCERKTPRPWTAENLNAPALTGNMAHGSIRYSKAHTLGWRPSCTCYDDRYRSDFPQAKSARKRYQRQVSGDWFRRVRKRAGLDSWPVVPCVVLDNFGGAGTTALVARQLGRDAILIELSPDYVEMTRRRLDGTKQVETTDHNGDQVTMEQGTMFSSVAVE